MVVRVETVIVFINADVAVPYESLIIYCPPLPLSPSTLSSDHYLPCHNLSAGPVCPTEVTRFTYSTDLIAPSSSVLLLANGAL